MKQEVPFTQDLLLIGGGHAHALVLKAWGMDPLPGARLTVINPGPTAPYTGMLPGHVAGHYARDALEIDLVRLCQHAGARFIDGRVIGIDRFRRAVTVEGRGQIFYDVASFDVGITAEMALPGFAAHGIGAKPLDRFADRWRAFRDQAAAGEVTPSVAVIGGGVAGCELAMAMQFALREKGLSPEVTVIEAGPQITGVSAAARAVLRAELDARGIHLLCGAAVDEVTEDHVVLNDGSRVPARFVVGAAGAFPHSWLRQTDLPLEDGFITVGADLGVKGDAHLFAVGDCAHLSHAPRPKAGVFAVRAAPVLHHNLRAVLSGGVRRRFVPQKTYLKLISLGGKSAMAEKFGRVVKGPAMWRWKDWIDQRFMDKLSELPPMRQPAPRGAVAKGLREALAAKPLCGGCGAKVSGGVLTRALGQLPALEGAASAGPGDDAAVLAGPGGQAQVISTDHLRALFDDPGLMARIALVHAMGDVWAMGAAPQAVLSSLTLPQMSAPLQARTLDEINAALQDVLAQTGGTIVGGHTTMGAELTIGFTVTGLCPNAPVTQAGAQPGDVLVLTRPLGTGVILAGHMQGKAKGPDVMGALSQMALPQHRAAKILAGAHAMTDVTGFGLAGHAFAMARASGVGFTLQHDALPVYSGVRGLIQAGIGSSLMPTNRADAPVEGPDDPLLFDPQTSGGLLAAVPEKDAPKLLRKLEEAGEIGWVIGRAHEGPARITLS
ncbi:MAG: selenide, water dikinase SelD [Pseudomonadota bacterium]